MYLTFSYLHLIIICPLIYVFLNWFLLLISFPMYSTKVKKEDKSLFFFPLNIFSSEYFFYIVHLSYTSLFIHKIDKEHTKEVMNIQK